MSKIKLVKKKGNLDRNIYIDLKAEEKEIKLNDFIEEANNPGKEYLYMGIDIWNNKQYIKAWGNNGQNSFYLDSVKKASSQIKSEKAKLKREKAFAKKVKSKDKGTRGSKRKT